MIPPWTYTIVAMLSASAVSADDFVGQADANSDGYVSLYELRAAYYADIEFNRRIEQSFAAYDTDGDGLISEAELRAQRAETAAITEPAAMQPAAAPAVAETIPTTAATETVAAVPSVATNGSDDSRNDATLVDKSGDGSLEASAAASVNAGSLPNAGGLSRTELRILEIDRDNSGGASVAELVASGDGRQWFTNNAFASADENGDGDLDPEELEVLLQSLERRRR